MLSILRAEPIICAIGFQVIQPLPAVAVTRFGLRGKNFLADEHTLYVGVATNDVRKRSVHEPGGLRASPGLES